jgi:hypothetical protein
LFDIIYFMQAHQSIIATARLDLIPAHEDLAKKVIEFYKRNKSHLKPWDPPTPPDSLTEDFQRKRLNKAEADARRALLCDGGYAFKATPMCWWAALD